MVVEVRGEGRGGEGGGEHTHHDCKRLAVKQRSLQNTICRLIRVHSCGKANGSGIQLAGMGGCSEVGRLTENQRAGGEDRDQGLAQDGCGLESLLNLDKAVSHLDDMASSCTCTVAAAVINTFLPRFPTRKGRRPGSPLVHLRPLLLHPPRSHPASPSNSGPVPGEACLATFSRLFAPCCASATALSDGLGLRPGQPDRPRVDQCARDPVPAGQG